MNSADWSRAGERDVTHLARRLTVRPDGTAHVELVDSQEALRTIAKNLGLLKERVEITPEPDPQRLRREILEKLGRGEA